MGIFGNDKLQDERLDALEEHVRSLTETVQANQADLAQTWIVMLGLQAQVEEKVSASDVDPTIVELNEKLGTARKELEESRDAASESWATLQGGVKDAFESLRSSVNKAYEQIKKA
jgi:predicted Holliday junction resolvase-like endonuclease